MAWLYIEPIRPTTPDEPASDPVDSDPVTMLLSPNRRSDPSGVLLPHLKLWPFSLAWPVQVKHSRNRAYPRCGLSATYHCMPLTSFLSQNTDKVVQMISWTFYFHFLYNFWRETLSFLQSALAFIFSYLLTQYDIQPTRRYHSIMLIHDSLNTGAFSPISPLHYTTNFYVPPGPYLLTHSHTHTSQIHKWLRAQSPIPYPYRRQPPI